MTGRITRWLLVVDSPYASMSLIEHYLEESSHSTLDLLLMIPDIPAAYLQLPSISTVQEEMRQEAERTLALLQKRFSPQHCAMARGRWQSAVRQIQEKQAFDHIVVAEKHRVFVYYSEPVIEEDVVSL